MVIGYLYLVFGFAACVSLCLISLLTGWTAERVQEYFVWASQVIKGVRGTNAKLEEILKQLFLERGVEI